MTGGAGTDVGRSFAAEATMPLRVCLAENAGVLSDLRTTRMLGIDLLTAEAVAQALNREFEAVWFESESDEDSSWIAETSALLSLDACDLVAGYPLYAPALGQPHAQVARPPRLLNSTSAHIREFVTLRPLVATRPYRASDLAIVAKGSVADEISALADLRGLRLLSEQGTLAGTILLRHGHGTLVADLTFVPPGDAFLWELEHGAWDAALVEVARFDSYRMHNPVTTLRLSEYRHPLVFNVGLAAIEEKSPLVADVNRVLDALLASGTIKGFAIQAGLTFRPPTGPVVHGALQPADLQDE